MTMIEEMKGYQLKDVITTSPRSIIVSGKQLENNASVIIKKTNGVYPSLDAINSFQYEYRILRLFDTAEIIKAYALEKVDNGLAIIMEDFGGDSLDRVQAEMKVSIKDFFHIASRIVRALAKIHLSKIIHRNINPGNIVWNRLTGEVKIIDFRFSSELSLEKQDINIQGDWTESLPYISPEQTGRMNRRLDYRSDFYSLGITFFELLTGQLPFQATDTIEWIHCHLAKTPPDPCKLNNRIDHSLCRVILKLMAKNAEDRYQSAIGIIKDLETCYEAFKAKRVLNDFVPGMWDVSQLFQIPQKPYGREPEVKTLLSTFDRTSQGSSEIILVVGDAGIGKSFLVNEIHKLIVQKTGVFIEGKCEQFERHVPYRALIQAFKSLVSQVLSESPEVLQSWKDRLIKALGPNGQIILDVIPDLERVIGPQPDYPQLNPVESQNRFIRTLIQFVSVFSTPNHPLVIFLDDLQWDGSPTFNLIQELITSRIKNLLIIGAYRGNEVLSDHPLTTWLLDLQTIKPVQQLTLNPLTEAIVNRLIADTFNCDPDRSKELAHLLFQKTNGNPFFLKELLKTLHQNESLYFDLEKNSWNWNIEQIIRENISVNVADLLVQRLKKLEPEVKHTLQLAACIGNIFDLQTLSTICEQTPAQVNQYLWSAIKAELVMPLNERYKMVNSEQDIHRIVYTFQHDRVQQTAYSMIEESQVDTIHRAIGRLLLKNIPYEALDDRIIDIAQHLNKSIRLMTDTEEKLELARVNLRAARKAKTSIAYHTALQFLEIAISLMPEGGWESHYELNTALGKEQIDCLYLNKQFKKAEERSIALQNKVRTDLERAEIYHLQTVQLSAVGESHKAILVAIQGLSLIGINLPLKPPRAVVLKELTLAKWYQGKRQISHLVNLPELKDPQKLIAMKLLMEVSGPIFTTNNTPLFASVVLKQVNISLSTGVCEESAYAFTIYGLLLNSFGRLKAGNEFGKLGIAINERFQDVRLRCRTIFMYITFIFVWNNHHKYTRTLFEQVIDTGFINGDLLYIGYAASQITNLDASLDIQRQIEDGEKHMAIIRENKLKGIFFFAIPHQLFRLNQAGLTKDRLSLETEEYSEEIILNAFIKAGNYTPYAVYWLKKMMVYHAFEESEAALECIPVLEEHSGSYPGTQTQMEVIFYSFLVYADLYPGMDKPAQRKAKKRLKRYHRQVSQWAAHCPTNFLHWKQLMEAEEARLDGETQIASDLYDMAIQTAQENDYMRYQALGNERAARFFLESGKERVASGYMREAIYCYERWKATEKVAFLKEKYTRILSGEDDRNMGSPGSTTDMVPFSIERTNKLLDINSVLSTSQAISEKIILPDLLEILLKTMVENSGAQYGCLILNRENRLMIDADYMTSRHDPVRFPAISADSTNETGAPVLPASLINYVARTHEIIILNNAGQSKRFGNDRYFIDNRSKSVLCQPILLKGKLNGLLYLENNLTIEAFTEERVQILRLLSAQAAVSIENAMLYTTLEESEKKYRQIFENSVDGIFQTTPVGKLISANPTLVKLMGYSSEQEAIELVEDLSRDIYVKSEDRLKVLEILESEGKINDLETDLRRKDGSVVSVSISAVSVRDKDGKLLYFDGNVKDITEQKKREKAERERNVAEAANVAKSEFLANISHELRTPMQGILGFSKLGAEKIDSLKKVKLQTYFQEISNSGDRLMTLLNDLLDLSRLESGKTLYYFAETDLSTIVRDTLNEFEIVCQNIAIEIKFQPAAARIPVVADYDKITQVIRNLLSNAFKFTKDNSTVSITVSSNSNSQIVSISDQGIGIPEAEKEKIFDKFYQSTKTRTGAGGTGLGLAICHEIINAHQGKIWAENNLDGGATFSFELKQSREHQTTTQFL